MAESRLLLAGDVHGNYSFVELAEPTEENPHV